MKTLQDLNKIKERTLENRNINNKNPDGIRIVVGMATCGIAAGARPILEAFNKEIAKREIDTAVVEQTGCIGMCMYEPMADVYMPGLPRTTYVNLTPEKVAKITSEHLINRHPCTQYTIGAEES